MCDTLSYVYQYVSSFTASLNLDAPAIYQQAAKTYDSTQSVIAFYVNECVAVIEEGVRLVVVHQQLEAVVHLQANVAKQCELRTYSGRMT